MKSSGGKAENFILVEILYCVHMQQKQWSHDLNHEFASSLRRKVRNPGAVHSWTILIGQQLFLPHTCEDHSPGGASPTLALLFNSDLCLFPRSDSLWCLRFFILSVVCLTGSPNPDEDDRPPPRKDFGLCIYRRALISRRVHELRNHLHTDTVTFLSSRKGFISLVK